MKKIAVLFSLLASASAFAADDCNQYEAQIIGTVQSIQQTQGSLCVAELSFVGSGNMYNPHFFCPLDKTEVQHTGVLLECDTQVGERVDGVLYRSSTDGAIFLY